MKTQTHQSLTPCKLMPPSECWCHATKWCKSKYSHPVYSESTPRTVLGQKVREHFLGSFFISTWQVIFRWHSVSGALSCAHFQMYWMFWRRLCCLCLSSLVGVTFQLKTDKTKKTDYGVVSDWFTRNFLKDLFVNETSSYSTKGGTHKPWTCSQNQSRH